MKGDLKLAIHLNRLYANPTVGTLVQVTPAFVAKVKADGRDPWGDLYPGQIGVILALLPVTGGYDVQFNRYGIAMSREDFDVIPIVVRP